MGTISFEDNANPVGAIWPLVDRVCPADTVAGEGYGFENALCMIESQSPSARPPASDVSLQNVEDVTRHTCTLSMRIAFLERILESIDVSVGRRRALNGIALIVVEELLAILGPDVVRRANDPTASEAERVNAAECLASAQKFADRLRSTLQPFSPGIVWC